SRHRRLNRGGNRQANAALYRIVLTRLRREDRSVSVALTLRTEAANTCPRPAVASSQWLFSGRQPGQRTARSAPSPSASDRRPSAVRRTSAIRQLVLQAPAPVIAKALGYRDKTVTRLVTDRRVRAVTGR
ncbi:hypothetical protein ACFWCA_49730, partial [Streptomyces phaeochromogenes]